jgi:pimeloyl-ACP methyl ester carboxylesterase
MPVLPNSRIPYADWGGRGPILHLAHGNGFPPGTYDDFAARLTGRLRVVGMECRALWGTVEASTLHHWRELADDLVRFLEELGTGPVIAVGHSLGAVTSLYAAAAHPQLVRGLVLIDPVLIPPWQAPLWAVAMALGLNQRSRLAVQARRRRVRWPNHEVMWRAYRAAPVFRRWREPFLRDYVQAGTEELADGTVRLRYPPAWEARIFETAPPDVWLTLPALRRLPLLVIRGELSETFLEGAMWAMRRLVPGARFVEIAGADHFVPMCRPREVADALLDFCAGLE